MKLSSKSYTSAFLLFYSFLFSCLIVVARYFPFFSIAVFLGSLSSLVYVAKPNKTRFSNILYILAMIFSLLILYLVNDFLVFINIITVFFLGSLLILPDGFVHSSLGFLHFSFLPFLTLFRTLSSRSEYRLQFISLLRAKMKLGKKSFYEIFVPIALSIIILIVIVPLLSSANPFFRKVILDTLSVLNLKELFMWIFSDGIFIWFIRLAMFGFLAYFVPRLITLTLDGNPIETKSTISYPQVNMSIPKIVTGFVLFLFFLTQLQLYFSTSNTLLSMGITHSDFAREVFTQLSVVAFVVLVLIYNDMSRKTFSKILTFILIFEGVFLALIALKSVYDYSFYWGFTHKRLWGFTVVFWILGVFSFFTFKYLKNFNNAIFVKSVMVFSCCVLIAVNLLNFDYLIYTYRKSVTHRGIDYYYLSGLSADSGSYQEQLKLLDADLNESSIIPEYSKNTRALVRLSMKIDALREKYKNIDFRAFNLSEYMQYQKIKSIDIEKYRKLWMPTINSAQVTPN